MLQIAFVVQVGLFQLEFNIFASNKFGNSLPSNMMLYIYKEYPIKNDNKSVFKYM